MIVGQCYFEEDVAERYYEESWNPSELWLKVISQCHIPAALYSKKKFPVHIEQNAG
jgi:hypothetical protein